MDRSTHSRKKRRSGSSGTRSAEASSETSEAFSYPGWASFLTGVALGALLYKAITIFFKDPSSEFDSSLQKNAKCYTSRLEACASAVENGRYAKHFKERRYIGKGSYGFVYEAEEVNEKVSYAIKKIKFKYSTKYQYGQVMNEIKNLAKLNHKNIVRYFTYWTELPHHLKEDEENFTSKDKITVRQDFCSPSGLSSSSGYHELEIQPFWLPECKGVEVMLFIQMEYCDSNLDDWLKTKFKGQKPPFEMSELKIFLEILEGLIYLHGQSFAHKDLAPRNILYSKANNSLKLADFGESSVLQQVTTKYDTGEVSFNENTQNLEISQKEDIFNLGKILLQVMKITKVDEVVEDIQKNTFRNELLRNWPKEFQMDLIVNLLKENPKERWTAKKIKKYLDGIGEEEKLEELKLKLEESKKRKEVTKFVKHKRQCE